MAVRPTTWPKDPIQPRSAVPAATAIIVPSLLADRVKGMMLDKLSGNVQINISKGEILGFHVHEIHSLKR